MSQTQRDTNSQNAVFAEDGVVSTAINMRNFASMIVRMPADWTAASIGFKVLNANTGTFLPLYDDDGNLVQIDSPDADGAYNAPAALAGAHWLQLWSQDGSGNDVAQTTAGGITLSVDLKS